jgi:hypothetical protein
MIEEKKPFVTQESDAAGQRGPQSDRLTGIRLHIGWIR